MQGLGRDSRNREAISEVYCWGSSSGWLLMTVSHSLFERIPGFERNILSSRHIDHMAGIFTGYRSHLARGPLLNGECAETSQRHTIVLGKRLLDAV